MRLINNVPNIAKLILNYQNPKIGWRGPLLFCVFCKNKNGWYLWKDRVIENWERDREWNRSFAFDRLKSHKVAPIVSSVAKANDRFHSRSHSLFSITRSFHKYHPFFLQKRQITTVHATQFLGFGKNITSFVIELSNNTENCLARYLWITKFVIWWRHKFINRFWHDCKNSNISIAIPNCVYLLFLFHDVHNFRNFLFFGKFDDVIIRNVLSKVHLV